MSSADPQYVWMGFIEECDLCHDEYPASWIEYNGQFLCQA